MRKKEIGKLGKLGEVSRGRDDWWIIDQLNLIIEKQNEIIDHLNTQPQTEEKLTGRKEGVDKGVDRGDTPEEKYKKGDKVKLTLADKDGWITGEFEVAGVEVEQPEEKEDKKLYIAVEDILSDYHIGVFTDAFYITKLVELFKNLLSERERFNKEELEYLNACVGIVWNKWKIKDKKPNDIMLERLKLKLKKLSKLTTK